MVINRLVLETIEPGDQQECFPMDFDKCIEILEDLEKNLHFGLMTVYRIGRDLRLVYFYGFRYIIELIFVK